ncbi:MAG: O-antigen polymerase, partial [Candidatus Zixiibacteriota bacterium]
VPILFAPDFRVSPFGLWVIVAVVVSIAVGSLLSYSMNDPVVGISQPCENILESFQTPLSLTVLILSLGSFLGAILLYLFGISRFNLTTSLLNILILPGEFSIDRYQGFSAFPAHIKLLEYLIFPASLMGGLGLLSSKTKLNTFLLMSPIFISLIYGSLLTTRSTILLSVIIWISGYLGGRVVSHDQIQKLFKPKFLIISTLSLVGFTILFLGTQILRQQGSTVIIEELLEKLKAYFFGYLPAFTTWVDHYPNEHLAFGTITFAGPFDLLGIVQRKPGFYQDIAILGTSHTNVYTALRGLISDFSIPGVLGLGVIIGLIETVAFRKCLKGSIYWLIPLTMFYAFTLYSPLISIFNYNSVLMTWVIILGIFLVVPKLSSK